MTFALVGLAAAWARGTPASAPRTSPRCRLLRRRRLHGPGRALHPRHGGAPRLAGGHRYLWHEYHRPPDRTAPARAHGWRCPSRRPLSSASSPSAVSMRTGVRALEEHRDYEPCYDQGEMKRNPTRSVSVGSVSLGSATRSRSRACAPPAPRTWTPPSSRPRPSGGPGGALVRVAVDSPKDVEALAEVRRQTPANLVVDLQENYRLAATVAPSRGQGPLQPRPPLAPREGRSRSARRSASSCDVARRARPRHPRRGQLRQRRPRDEGPPPRGRRRGHGGVGPRALPDAGRPRLRPLRGEPQGLAPAQGHRGQPPLRRRCAPTCPCTSA